MLQYKSLRYKIVLLAIILLNIHTINAAKHTASDDYYFAVEENQSPADHWYDETFSYPYEDNFFMTGFNTLDDGDGPGEDDKQIGDGEAPIGDVSFIFVLIFVLLYSSYVVFNAKRKKQDDKAITN